MKFFYSILIVLSSIVLSFSASQQKKSLGIKIGPYFSTIRYYEKVNDDVELHTFETQANPALSIYFDVPQSKSFVHSFNCSYYKNSGEKHFSVPFYTNTYAISLQYLGFGYAFKGTAQIDRFTPYFSGGFSLDFLIDFDSEGYNAILNSIDPIYPDDKDDINPFTARVILGGGIEYSLVHISLVLEYVFSYNLIPFYIWESDNESTRHNETAYGSTLSIGVKIPF